MRGIIVFLMLCLSALALVVFNMPMSAQNVGYPFPGYPAEFAPSRTVRIPPPSPPTLPRAKFTKFQNAVPDEYIVVLKDDAQSKIGNASDRRAKVRDVANRMLPIGSQLKAIFGTVLRGFTVKLPNEAAAVALSQDPRIEYVESNRLDGLATTGQTEKLGRLARISRTSWAGANVTYPDSLSGSGVTAYDVGPGVLTTHNEFGSRAYIAADIVADNNITDYCTISSTNNDCDGHGTAMLGIIGGATYGVATSASLASVKFWYRNSSNQQVLTHSYAISAVEWLTDHHNDNPTELAVANLSFQMTTDSTLNRAIKSSVKAGVTYSIAAGNNNLNLDTNPHSPSQIGGYYALVTGAEDQRDNSRLRLIPSPSPTLDQSSDYGSRLAVWAPGYHITSAFIPNNDSTFTSSGTSRASAQTAGAVALYLQGRTGMNDCGSHWLRGQSSSTTGAAISTCPDRVNQFIMSNATLNALATTGDGAIGSGSPNRILYTGSIPTTSNFNPIDNQRFFVWQHYGDFLPEVTNPDIDHTFFPEDDTIPASPDESGLDWWTHEITGGTGHQSDCNTEADWNHNDSCTNTWRINTSRAFWVDRYPTWFTQSYGLSSSTNNTAFVIECYSRYLRRTVTTSTTGVQGWIDDLDTYGTPANADGVRHMIDAFINSTEYRQRFGGSS